MSTSRGWIVSPLFDLLFLANLGWLILLLPGFATQIDTAIDFWVIYFITLPHRWITLVLVVLDPDRRAGRSRGLSAIAVLALIVVAGAYFGSGAFLCLAAVDYVWNAWHFASQHAGVLRMYGKKVGGGNAWLERWGVRGFVTYTALRAAGWATGWAEHQPDALAIIGWVDMAWLVAPALLILTNLVDIKVDRLGKLAYLGSVCTLYTGFLLSLHFQQTAMIVVFAAAGSMFHAVEYLAVVSHYAHRRQSVGSDGLFRGLARSWLLFLGLYLTLLGSFGAWAARPDSGIHTFWMGVNLWVAFVHYAFDGMIWKLRQPQTAAALGVTVS